jgi:allantoinase
MAPIIIRSTRVFLPSGIQPAEIEIDGERIAAIRPHPSSVLQSSAARPPSSVRDVGSALVMPGLVDTHVHVNEPGRTEWEGFQTATAAAAAGGITTIVDMPLNSQPATTTVRGLEVKRATAPVTGVEVAFWGGIVPGNREELDDLASAGVRGFKAFMSPSGVDEFPAVEPHDLRRAMPVLARRNLPLLVHAEWPSLLHPVSLSADPRRYRTWLDSRPPEAELQAILLLIALCREFAVRVHVVHLATELALPLFRSARAEGLPLSVETCPHYLTFAAEEIADGDTWLKCAPPIRGRATREALWRGLADGDIDLVASDHSPCPPSMQAGGDFLQAWGGIASLELSLPVTWTGASARGIGLESIVEWMCARPARLAGLDGRKGSIAEGKDADLVVWDPAATFVVDERALRQRHKRTPYAGRELRGRVIATYARGRLVYGDGVAGPEGPACIA